MWDARKHPKGTLGMKFPNRASMTEDQKRNLSLSHIGIKYPSFSKERHWNWKGGVTEKNEAFRKSAEYKQWRGKVFARDNYTCQICSVRGGQLHADHIKPFTLFPEFRLNVANGRTLCEKCHKQTDTFGVKVRNYEKEVKS